MWKVESLSRDVKSGGYVYKCTKVEDLSRDVESFGFFKRSVTKDELCDLSCQLCGNDLLKLWFCGVAQ